VDARRRRFLFRAVGGVALLLILAGSITDVAVTMFWDRNAMLTSVLADVLVLVVGVAVVNEWLDIRSAERWRTVAYYALVEPRALERSAASPDTRLARLSVPWLGETGGPVDAVDDDGTPLPLAFDHAAILGTAVKRIRGKLDYAPIGFELLPPRFSLRELRLVHEAILGRQLNKDSFRRRVLDRGLVLPIGERDTTVGHRPPELYRFAARRAR